MVLKLRAESTLEMGNDYYSILGDDDGIEGGYYIWGDLKQALGDDLVS